MKSGLRQALEVLKSGGVVVCPTDTAYGMAVDATNPSAVKKLYQLKGRDFKKPIHVIPPTKAWVEKLVKLNSPAKLLIDELMPGPITLVLPLKAKGEVYKLLSAGTKSLGIRRPKNKIALDLAMLCGKPITATSANVSGQPNCYSVAQVKKQFGKKASELYFLDAGKLPKVAPSTVVAIRGKNVTILREGPVSKAAIMKAI
ncbi:MAG TPA: L-threonylcarbamoyladenylate synthase [Patescibacteria group bacterium]|nr:L-threonylcarbamoyladenylate synthase [Patescibacteria group bacterium]